MFLVGLTGGIASGKSTVSQMLRLLDCEIIDADKIAREVVEPGKPAWNKIVKTFGKDILLPTGEIDRIKLAEIVFSDSQKRRMLNKCTHPAIQKAMLWKIVKLFFQGHRFAVLDVPLLFESGVMARFMNKIIVVYCDQETQLSRLMERNGYTEEEAQLRIGAQMPLNEKCQWATHVIDNSRSKAETVRQVKNVHEELTGSWAFLRVRVAFVILLGGIAILGYWLVQRIR